MNVFETPQEFIAWRKQYHGSLAFVPTMGALHPGHISLVQQAHQYAEKVVASIFVNPLQFNSKKDFELYPKTVERDLALLADAGVSVVFAPKDPQSIYREPHLTSVSVNRYSSVLEGASRPGHFCGVTTVVSILFNIVQPSVALFGEKDFQQVSIIEKMVKDLWLSVKIQRCPIVRESDGLAMSSRNVRLTPQGRIAALVLSKALFAMQQAVRSGMLESESILALGKQILTAEPRVTLDYLKIITEQDLAETAHVSNQSRALVAAIVDEVRLIDTVALCLPEK